MRDPLLQRDPIRIPSGTALVEAVGLLSRPVVATSDGLEADAETGAGTAGVGRAATLPHTEQ
jgi:hypothetical protein